ncbi:unnamed protein product [Ceratitis capitata]|uniref:(Mediterranean fruit fly) hypothetical protein n=1 Tax=Ceratitis capitata TaxID=7213 RepID=A0A811UKW1_CERCA|nr:unnamed protein product [Ceratitis capitata]
MFNINLRLSISSSLFLTKILSPTNVTQSNFDCHKSFALLSLIAFVSLSLRSVIKVSVIGAKNKTNALDNAATDEQVLATRQKEHATTTAGIVSE